MRIEECKIRVLENPRDVLSFLLQTRNRELVLLLSTLKIARLGEWEINETLYCYDHHDNKVNHYYDSTKHERVIVNFDNIRADPMWDGGENEHSRYILIEAAKKKPNLAIEYLLTNKGIEQIIVHKDNTLAQKYTVDIKWRHYRESGPIPRFKSPLEFLRADD
jgi:hypothetical protein